MAARVNFKLAYNGTIHKFTSTSLLNDELFRAVKGKVSSIVKETDPEMYWNDGDSDISLECAADLNMAIGNANITGECPSKPPCVYLFVTDKKIVEIRRLTMLLTETETEKSDLERMLEDTHQHYLTLLAKNQWMSLEEKEKESAYVVEISELQAKVNQLEMQIRGLGESLANEINERDQIELSKKSLENEKAVLSVQLEGAQEQYEEIRGEHASLRRVAEKENADLLKENEGLRATVKKLDEKNDGLQMKIAKTFKESAELNFANLVLKEEIEEMSKNLGQAHQSKKALLTSHYELQRSIVVLEEAKAEMDTVVREKTIEIDQLTTKLADEQEYSHERDEDVEYLQKELREEAKRFMPYRPLNDDVAPVGDQLGVLLIENAIPFFIYENGSIAPEHPSYNAICAEYEQKMMQTLMSLKAVAVSEVLQKVMKMLQQSVAVASTPQMAVAQPTQPLADNTRNEAMTEFVLSPVVSDDEADEDEPEEENNDDEKEEKEETSKKEIAVEQELPLQNGDEEEEKEDEKIQKARISDVLDEYEYSDDSEEDEEEEEIQEEDRLCDLVDEHSTSDSSETDSGESEEEEEKSEEESHVRNLALEYDTDETQSERGDCEDLEEEEKQENDSKASLPTLILNAATILSVAQPDEPTSSADEKERKILEKIAEMKNVPFWERMTSFSVKMESIGEKMKKMEERVEKIEDGTNKEARMDEMEERLWKAEERIEEKRTAMM